MDEKWHTELNELRETVQDLSRRLTAAEQAREAQDAALALAISQHPANGPAREPTRRRHLRLAPRLALRRRPPARPG